jgi:hypothetical protein
MRCKPMFKWGYDIFQRRAGCVFDTSRFSSSAADAAIRGAYRGTCGSASNESTCLWGGCYPNSWDERRRIAKCGGTLGRTGYNAARLKLVSSCSNDTCVSLGPNSGLLTFDEPTFRNLVPESAATFVGCAVNAELSGRGIQYRVYRTGPGIKVGERVILDNMFYYGARFTRAHMHTCASRAQTIFPAPVPANPPPPSRTHTQCYTHARIHIRPRTHTQTHSLTHTCMNACTHAILFPPFTMHDPFLSMAAVKTQSKAQGAHTALSRCSYFNASLP